MPHVAEGQEPLKLKLRSGEVRRLRQMSCVPFWEEVEPLEALLLEPVCSMSRIRASNCRVWTLPDQALDLSTSFNFMSLMGLFNGWSLHMDPSQSHQPGALKSHPAERLSRVCSQGCGWVLAFCMSPLRGLSRASNCDFSHLLTNKSLQQHMIRV